jgi:ATP-binding cassette subfamily C protein LapB|tara:strand:- start:673 stop:2379 length:1707 start_codon:yes stop_codon:yes gene_type:complete
MDSESKKESHWFWGSVYKYRSIYYQVLLASLFINLFALASAFYIMTVYDKVVPNNAISSLIALTAGVFLVIVFDFITKMIRGYFIDVGGSLLDDDLAERLFRKFVSHDVTKLGNSPSKLAASVKEFDGVRDFFGSATMVTLVDFPFMIVFVGVLWAIGGMVALVPTLIIPLVIIVAATIHPLIKGYAEKNLNASQGKLGVLLELLGNIETVKTVSGGEYLKTKWHKSVGDLNRASIISRTIGNIAVTFSQSGLQLSQTFMIFYGVFLIAAAELSMGALIACVILSGRALAPLGQIGALLTRFNTAIAGYKRIDELMSKDAADEKFDAFEHKGSIREGAISIKGLNWSVNERKILQDINIEINAGEKIALVGSLGSGKSSLIKCLVGFNSVEQNIISIDNYDIKSISPEVMRKNIGYSPQTIQLFTGTIYENIGMGYDDASEEDIEKVCEIVGIHKFIGSLPGGYNYVLDENGRNLSGGQKKSITLARALIKQPKILILDEPTSSMDGTSMTQFIKNLKEIYTDYTLIIATHNAQDLSLVDRVIAIVDGKVVNDLPKENFLANVNKTEI